MNWIWIGLSFEIKQVLHLILPFHSICIGYGFNIRLLVFVVIPRFNEIFCPPVLLRELGENIHERSR
jgi:hypothetical protein